MYAFYAFYHFELVHLFATLSNLIAVLTFYCLFVSEQRLVCYGY